MAKTDDVLFTGTKSGLLVRLSEDEEFHVLKERLREKLENYYDFFQGSSVTVDVGNRVLTTKELLELESMFSKKHGLRLLQVVNAGQHEDDWEPGDTAVAPNTRFPPVSIEMKGSKAINGRRFRKTMTENKKEAGAQQANRALNTEELETLLVKRTLRSGQKVRFNGNVVVLGDVNPGAEIIASGDIIVVGSLRGVAHAGATGYEGAVVAAYRLAPTQLRIAQHISRPPDEEAGEAKQPEIACIRDGRIMIDVYISN